MRFLLGVAEAGFFPGVIYYFASWFPISHRGRAVSRFYVGAPLSSLVMGAASGWLLALDGRAGLQGWQWLFLVQALPSVLVGLAVLRFLPDKPAAVAWLTAAEKRWIEAELKREAATIVEPSSHHPLASLRNPMVLLLAATGFLCVGVNTTISLSAPLMLLDLAGFDATHVGYLVSLGGVLGALSMLVGGDYADRRGDRFQNAFWLTLVMAGGLALLAAAPPPMVVVLAYLSVTGSCFTVAMLVVSGWTQVMHARELAVGSAAINSVCNLGAFAMPVAWGASRDATGGFAAGLAALTVSLIASAALTWWVRAAARTRRLAAAEAAVQRLFWVCIPQAAAKFARPIGSSRTACYLPMQNVANISPSRSSLVSSPVSSPSAVCAPRSSSAAISKAPSSSRRAATRRTRVRSSDARWRRRALNVPGAAAL
jgi:ACS family tartrate transporter-like MFS transporter